MKEREKNTLNIKWEKISFNAAAEVEKWRQIDGRFRRSDCTLHAHEVIVTCVDLFFYSSKMVNTCQGIIWLDTIEYILDYYLRLPPLCLCWFYSTWNDHHIRINGSIAVAYVNAHVCVESHCYAYVNHKLDVIAQKNNWVFFRPKLSHSSILSSIRMLLFFLSEYKK